MFPRNKKFERFVALFVILGLIVPSPAYSARQVGTAQSPFVLDQVARDLLLTANASRAEVRQVRFGFDQIEPFYTNSYASYKIGNLFENAVRQIPDKVVNAIRTELSKHVEADRLRSALVHDFGATDLDVHVTHNFGEQNASVHRLIFEAVKAGLKKAQEMKLVRINIDSLSDDELIQKLRVLVNDDSKIERPAEPVVIAKGIGVGIGAVNIKLYREFAMGITPLQKLGLSKSPGFRFRVKRTADILAGKLDGPEWEFEISEDQRDKDGKVTLPGINERTKLQALASQPNEYQITAVYPVEGGALPSNEAIATVVYQPVFANGEAALNPTIIYRSQSGADAVGGIANMLFGVSYVPGGKAGEYYVATYPVTLKEARRSPTQEGLGYFVAYGYQSRKGGEIPREGYEDLVAQNLTSYGPQRRLAKKFAKAMSSHGDAQPYLAPFAAERKMEHLRKEQEHLFQPAPKEAERDPILDPLEEGIKSEGWVVVGDDKADMGGVLGHTRVPEYMIAVYKATLHEAIESGILTDGNTFGLIDHERVRDRENKGVGDDGHLIMFGENSIYGPASHQLSFLAFTRAYHYSHTLSKQPYGEGQDYQGAEAKNAKANPELYSQYSERYFELLRQYLPESELIPQRFPLEPLKSGEKFVPGVTKVTDKVVGIDWVRQKWLDWQRTGKGTQLAEPFSGNVTQQGIGSARYAFNPAVEGTFDILAGDKMGPPAFNLLIQEGVFKAADSGRLFKSGLVFEIWDLKAFPPGITAETATPEQLKEIPTKRIFLDAKENREMIKLYLADSDRFNVRNVWLKKQEGWEIEQPQKYLDRVLLSSSVTRLGILTGGEYVGKDDPLIIGNSRLMEFLHEFLRTRPLIVQGDMNGSHWEQAVPSSLEQAVATIRSHPILASVRYTVSKDGRKFTRVEDIFGQKIYDRVRKNAHEFNDVLDYAQLSQFEPHGTNVRTVEASYELAKILRELNQPNSPFLVQNKKRENPNRAWPEPVANHINELYSAVLSDQARSEARQSIRVAINGVGQIGREIIRAWVQNPGNAEIVAINDIFQPNMMVGLEMVVDFLKTEFQIAPRSRAQDAVFDYGRDENREYWISINGKRIAATSERRPEDIPWHKFDVDVVIEATGVFTEASQIEGHLKAGAKRVVLAAPSRTPEIWPLVPPFNTQVKDQVLNMWHASTPSVHAIAPPLKVLADQFGVKDFFILTTQAMTNDQRVLTLHHADLPRAYTASENIIPVSTGAAAQIGLLIPKLAGKGSALNIRVPVTNGSLVGVIAAVEIPTSVSEVYAALRKASQDEFKGLMTVLDEPTVTYKIVGRPESSIVDANLIRVNESGKLVTVFSWIDNKFGYANRVWELAQLVGSDVRAEARSVHDKEASIPSEIIQALEAQLPSIRKAVELATRAEVRQAYLKLNEEFPIAGHVLTLKEVNPLARTATIADKDRVSGKINQHEIVLPELPADRRGMLVLSRHRGEVIMIGDNIKITIVDIHGDKVRIGINAPTDIPVHRQEVYDAIQREKREKEEKERGGRSEARQGDNIRKAIGIGTTYSSDFFENISDYMIDEQITAGATEFTMNPYSTGNYVIHLLTLMRPEAQEWTNRFLAVQDQAGWSQFKQELAQAPGAVQKALKAALEPTPFVTAETEREVAQAMFRSMLDEAKTIDRMVGELNERKATGEPSYWVIADYFANKIAAKVYPFYEQSGGKTGYVSYEVDPRIERPDFIATLEEQITVMKEQAERIGSLQKNILVKAPATRAGLATIQAVNAHFNETLAFVPEDGIEAINLYEARRDSAHGLRISPFVSRNAVYFEEFWSPFFKEADGHVATIANTYETYEALAARGYEDKAIWSSLGIKVKGDPEELYSLQVAGVGILNMPPATARAFNQADITIERKFGVKSLEDIIADYFQAVQQGKIPSAAKKFKELMAGRRTPRQQAQLAIQEYNQIKNRLVDAKRLDQVVRQIRKLETQAGKRREFTREGVGKVRARVKAGEAITEKELMRVILKSEGEEKFIIPFQGAIDNLDKALLAKRISQLHNLSLDIVRAWQALETPPTVVIDDRGILIPPKMSIHERPTLGLQDVENFLASNPTGIIQVLPRQILKQPDVVFLYVLGENPGEAFVQNQLEAQRTALDQIREQIRVQLLSKIEQISPAYPTFSMRLGALRAALDKRDYTQAVEKARDLATIAGEKITPMLEDLVTRVERLTRSEARQKQPEELTPVVKVPNPPEKRVLLRFREGIKLLQQILPVGKSYFLNLDINHIAEAVGYDVVKGQDGKIYQEGVLLTQDVAGNRKITDKSRQFTHGGTTHPPQGRKFFWVSETGTVYLITGQGYDREDLVEVKKEIPFISAKKLLARSEARQIVVEPLVAEVKTEVRSALAEVFRTLKETPNFASRITASHTYHFGEGMVFDPEVLFQGFGEFGDKGYLIAALALRSLYGNEPVAIPLPIPNENDVEGLKQYRAQVRLLNEINEFLVDEGLEPFAVTASVGRAVQVLKKLGAKGIRAIVGTSGVVADAIRKQLPDTTQIITSQRFESMARAMPQFAALAEQLVKAYRTIASAA